MAMKDLHNNINELIAVNTTTVSTDTTTVGNAIDMQGYESIEFMLVMGAQTDGDFSMVLTECATSNGSYTAVDDADLLGTEPAFTTDTDQNKIASVGYIGSLRFLKMTVVSANTATTGATFTGVAIQGHATDAPVPADDS